MPGTAISHMIFFIASIVVATMVVGGLYAVSQDFVDALEEKGQANSDSLRTSIVILNDPVAMPYDNVTDELHVYVKNVGQRGVDTSSVLVFVDGFPVVPDNATVVVGVQWVPGSTLDVTVTVTIADGDHSLKVTAEHGSSDSIWFRTG
jgi:flagellar protein FlaG